MSSAAALKPAGCAEEGAAWSLLSCAEAAGAMRAIKSMAFPVKFIASAC
jgi:hypothetical protein